MDILKQKRFWVTRKFELDDFGVTVFYKDLRKEHEIEISYKSIKGGRERLLEGYVGFYIIFRICSIGLPLSFFALQYVDWITYKEILFLFLLGLFALAIYYLSRQDLIKISLSNETKLYFFKNRPHADDVNRFIDSMINRRDQFMRKTYLEFDELGSYENQKHNLNILYDYKVIDLEEFEEEKLRLKNLFKVDELDQKEIGFK